MPSYSFVVPGDPVPQPRPRVSTRGGFARAYVPEDHPVHAYRQAIAMAAVAAGVQQTDQPVEIYVYSKLKRPKSHYCKSGLRSSAPLLPRYDADNVLKAVMDALKGIAYIDDKQAGDVHSHKRYGHESYTRVTICDLFIET